MGDVYQEIYKTELSDKKLKEILTRLERYYGYFHVAYIEDDTPEKYQELFNTITQIPAEMLSFVKRKRDE